MRDHPQHAMNSLSQRSTDLNLHCRTNEHLAFERIDKDNVRDEKDALRADLAVSCEEQVSTNLELARKEPSVNGMTNA